MRAAVSHACVATMQHIRRDPSPPSWPLQSARFLPPARLMTFDALVLNASLRQALVTVRSLGRRGLRVAAAADRTGPAFSSRWCEQGFVFPPEEASDAYLGTLERWLDATGARIVIPSHDGTIALLRQHHARLEKRGGAQGAHLALADEPALAVAVNKHCESWLGNGNGGARVASELVVTHDEARRAVERFTRFGDPILFQQLLTGRREAVSFLYAGGEIYARFAQWAMRTHPPLGGASVLRQSIAMPPDIGRQAESLVRDINLEGYSEVEFRRDATGVPYLMEINPRLSASVEVAVRAGVDFPYLLYQWASGRRLERHNGYRVGGWMRHLGGDIETTVDSLQQRGRPGIPRPVNTLVDFGITFLRPMSYDYVDWKDPLPAVRATTGFIRTTLKRLWSRMRRLIQ